MWGYSTLPALIGRIASREARGPGFGSGALDST